MHVLVYFDEAEERVARRVVAELAKHFRFRVELLTRRAPADMAMWHVLSQEPVVVRQTNDPFEQAIRAMCTSRRYDLVVAAPSERRGILRLLLGSRLGRFAGAAPATVWVPRGEPRPLRRILVGISGGPQSEQDARLAGRLAAAFGARLGLVHVVSQLPLVYTSPGDYHPAPVDLDQLATLDPGVRELERVAELLRRERLDPQVMLRKGTVLDELVAVCQGDGDDAPVDLLVIGAHAPSGAGGTDYFVNLAEQIVEAVPCSTLVVHAESDWSAWTLAQPSSP